MKRFAKASLAALATMTLVAGCNTGTDTTVAPPPTGVFTTVTTELRDSTQFPAGTAVVVRSHVTHQGLPISTVGVTYTVLSGKGTLSAATATTDTLGVVSVTWTLSDSAGVNSLIIASGDGADTLHLVGVIGAPSALLIVGPDSANVAAGASQALQVKVVDRAGNPVANTVVNWSTTGGTLSSTTGASDANGIAGTTLVTGQPGEYLVTADLPNKASIVFKVVAR